MTQDEILLLITNGLESTFQIERSRITPTATLYEDLDLDSIDAVDLAAKLQREAGVRLSPEAFKSVRTVGDLAAVLDVLLNSEAGTVEGTADAGTRSVAPTEPQDQQRN